MSIIVVVARRVWTPLAYGGWARPASVRSGLASDTA
jgi:hypothetical protein